MRKLIGLGIAAQLIFWISVGYCQVTTGTISGMVTDSSGAVLPGATITILNDETGISRSVSTDAAGRYSVPSLSLGSYRVTATHDGFQTETRSGIELTVGRDAVVNLQLAVGAVTQSVEVTGEAPLVDTTKATVSSLVGERTIRELPLNGRDLTQLLLINPGVVQAENSNAPLSSYAYNGFGKTISIGGMRGEDNAYLLDGTYINDMNHHLPAGPAGTLMGAETVQEFQVLTNFFGAQYGRAQGGVFNAVSKAGTNALHGSVYEFLRNSDLDAATWEDNAFGGGVKAPFKRNQFGGSAGGPIKKDKVFFFAAYEGWRQRLGITTTDNVFDNAARTGVIGSAAPVSISPLVTPYLAQFPLANGRDLGNGIAQYTYVAAEPVDEDFGQARVDYQISPKDSFFGRVSVDRARETAPTNYPVFQTEHSMATTLTTLSDTHIFTPRALETFRFSFNRVNPIDQGTYPSASAEPGLTYVLGQPSPPAILVTGLTSWEGDPKPLDFWTTNRFNVNTDINLTLGSHTLQFGGMFEHQQFNEDQPDRPFGEWTFNTLANFLEAVPVTMRSAPPTLGSSIRGFRQNFFAAYAQDDWRVNRRLTLNLGVRWEPFTLPTEVNGLIANLRHLTDSTDTRGNPYWQNHSLENFSPRFGLAWDPFGTGKTSVRAGIGLYYMPNDAAYYRSQTTRNTLFPDYTVTNPTGFPYPLVAIANAASAPEAEEAVPYYGLKSPHALNYTVNVQQQLPGQNMVSVGFVASHGIDQNCYCEYDSIPFFFDGLSLAVSPTNDVHPNPNFSSVYYYADAASSWYDGLTVMGEHRFSKGLEAKINYTFSKLLSESDSSSTTDQSGSGGGNPRLGPDLSAVKGNGGYDIPQLFTASYVYDLPLAQNWKGAGGKVLSGWEMSGIFTAQSGQPFTLTAAGTTAFNNLVTNLTRSPNLLPGFTPSSIIQGNPNQFYNPHAFADPSTYELGNVDKNFLRGPSLFNWSFGLSKNFAVTERWKLQFRAEMFNLLNHPIYANPSGAVYLGTGALSGAAGQITSTVIPSRQIQFALKVIF